jgi:hypothetical protein
MGPDAITVSGTAAGGTPAARARRLTTTGGPLRIFFVPDIHGSVKCFRKLVNAGKFYRADLLIMGGDLAGKQLVPVVARGGGSRVHYNIADGLVQHESSWYGDGWLRQRPGGDGAPPCRPLALTPALAADGARFR